MTPMTPLQTTCHPCALLPWPSAEVRVFLSCCWPIATRASTGSPQRWPGGRGRDLSAGGTWLGLTSAGQLALVTNVREPGRVLPGSPSRGELVPRWLQAGPAAQRADAAAALVALTGVARNGFNLIVADLAALCGGQAHAGGAHWVSNRPHPQHRSLGPGFHGVSNAALDSPWPKVLQLKRRLGEMLMDTSGSAGTRADELEALQNAGFAALADPRAAADVELPATGLPLLRERQLSPAFIRIVGGDPALAVYGTRCATVVAVQQYGAERSVHVVERSFDAAGSVSAEVRYDWPLPAA
jgi:uncharacterized protein with NRDE domain